MSNNAHIASAATAHSLLGALNEQLELTGYHYDVIVIGGSALLALELISRPTRDIDVVALAVDCVLAEAVPLPEPLVEARDRVARDFGVPTDWLNSQAGVDMIRLGFPAGFYDRLVVQEYGSGLTIRWASRLDLIHFKLHASVDHGGGKHFTDLQALEPTDEELLAAGRWARTHDPSPGFLDVLKTVLEYLRVDHGRLDA